MKLFSYYRSSSAYRVRIALNLKGLDYTIVPVNLLRTEHQSEDYSSLNPQQLVPALVLDDGTTLSQSMAILEWLDQCYPSPALLPAPPMEQAAVRSVCHSIACDMQPLNNMSITAYLKANLRADEDDIHAWYTQWMHRGFTGVETAVRGNGGLFCFGETAGMADCLLIPQMFNAYRFDVDMSPFPTLERIFEHCNQQDAFIRAHPSRQPDTPETP